MSKKKSCKCQFCKDYAWLNNELLPAVPKKMRKRVDAFFSNAWNAQEDLSYKAAILDGSWPDAVQILGWHLESAKLKVAKEEALYDPKNEI